MRSRTLPRIGATAAVLAAVLLLGSLPLASAAAPAYPTGTFTIIGPTTRYLDGYDSPLHGAPVQVRIEALSPGARVEGIATGAPDSTNYPPEYGYDSAVGAKLDLWYYGTAGTFTPRIFVSDSYGQTSVVALPPITLLTDTTPPTGDVTLPAAGIRGTAAAWRNLTGHRADAQTRISLVQVHLMQRRKGIWYVYSSMNERWRKGTRSEAGTYASLRTSNRAATASGTDGWIQPTIKGLTKGLLVVRVLIRNRAGLETRLPAIRQYLAK